VANYNSGADWNGVNGNVTTVGSVGSSSESFYGTADQTGNVYEWNETINAIDSSYRCLRSGDWATRLSLFDFLATSRRTRNSTLVFASQVSLSQVPCC